MLSNEQEPLYIPDDTTTLQILRRRGLYALDVDFLEHENDRPGNQFRVVQRISEAWQELACKYNWLEEHENVFSIGIEWAKHLYIRYGDFAESEAEKSDQLCNNEECKTRYVYIKLSVFATGLPIFICSHKHCVVQERQQKEMDEQAEAQYNLSFPTEAVLGDKEISIF